MRWCSGWCSKGRETASALVYAWGYAFIQAHDAAGGDRSGKLLGVGRPTLFETPFVPGQMRPFGWPKLSGGRLAQDLPAGGLHAQEVAEPGDAATAALSLRPGLGLTTRTGFGVTDGESSRTRQ